MDYLPVFLDIKNKRCLVVGGGDVALRKVVMLQKAGANVHIVSPALCESLSAELAAGQLTHQVAEFQDSDVSGCALVIAATNNHAVNRAVSGICHAQNIPVNVVDQPELCSFIMPAIIDRSPIIAAVSSGGRAPVLVRLIRARIESVIPAATGQLADLVDAFRLRVKAKFGNIDKQRQFWDDVLTGPVADLVFSGQIEVARERLQSLLDGHEAGSQTGIVSLVGAGPGDPELLTFRALRALQQADVVVYDRLVSEAILDLSRRDADKIHVGKTRSAHTVQQADINQMLVSLAQSGKRVVRLKGGDPFIFGRGGEEITTLATHNIPFQVVPGITAASGCASYAGIPLTHRDYAHQCVFVTGHLKNDQVNLDWQSLAKMDATTIVIYMGLVGLTSICEQLIAHGKPADTRAALIEQGTTKKQRTFAGTLSTLPDIVAAANVVAPTLIIIGGVVALRDTLAWYDEL